MRTRFIPLGCLLAAVLLGSSVCSHAQGQATAATPQTAPASDAGSSLAAAARRAKAPKAHAKKIFTDDDLEVNAGPLPRLKMDGAEKGDDVLAAIVKYKQSHTAEQTEQAVHSWFDGYDEMLTAALQENHDMTELRSVNMSNGNELCQQSQDYQQCQNRQMAELRGSRTDQTQMIKNTALIMRIQRSFMNVRSGLFMNNLHYSWFKIRGSVNGDEM